MNVVKCSNGHFFDGDTYQNCPHCGAPIGNTASNTHPETKEKKKGPRLFGRKQKVQETNPATSIGHQPHMPESAVNAQRQTADVGGFSDEDEPTLSLFDDIAPENASSTSQKDDMIDLCRANASKPVNDAGISAQGGSGVELAENRVSTGFDADPVDNSAITTSTDIEAESSLREAVKRASASSGGKTMSYFSAVAGNASVAENKSQASMQSEPVVGWLVCVKGYHFGECFSIFAGKNSIGRSFENRVVIADDSSISRAKHALIVYEPKKRDFYLQPGDSSGLTYLNDDYITESHKLSSHDMIELGDSKFMFIPLCDKTFSWEDFISKGE